MMSKANRLRRQILDASIDLLRTGGVGALSMREVARRAGVSHQAPYHHFADREAILAAIAEEGFAGLADSLGEARRGAGTMPERLRAMGLAYVDFALSHPAHFRVMFRPELVEMSNFPNAMTEGARAYGELRGLVQDLLGEPHGLRGSEGAWTMLQWSLVHGMACLLIDGPLWIAVPTLEQRHAAVVEALDTLIVTFATLGGAAAPESTKRAPRKRPRKRK